MAPSLSQTSGDVGLVADIGGTNARFAIAARSPEGGVLLSRPETLGVAEHKTPKDAVRAYLEGASLESPNRAPKAIVFAVAGPVAKNRIAFTNNDWEIDGAALGKDIAAQSCELINDYTALAIVAPHLKDEDLQKIGRAREQAPRDTRIVAVLGPGTGLGVGGLASAKGVDVPIVTEAGHTNFAPVDAYESAILAHLSRDVERVDNERILSGAGLRSLYEAVAAVEGAQTAEYGPPDITRLGAAGEDPLCEKTLGLFCAKLGDFAGDIALSMGAVDGVYIAGGIVPRIMDYFAASAFRERFVTKERFRDYMERIPTAVITHPYAALAGAAMRLFGAQEVRFETKVE